MTDVGRKTIEGLKKIVEQLETGEPISVTKVQKHETPDGPMHTFEKTTLNVKPKQL